MNTSLTTLLASVALLVILTKGRILALPLRIAVTVLRAAFELALARPYRVAAWMVSLLLDYGRWVFTGFLPTAVRMWNQRT